jgi:GvpD gas vesicle protein
MFISRKITEQALYNRFPWVSDFVKPNNILSVSGTDFTLDDPSFMITNIINSVSNRSTKVEDPFVALTESKKPFVILDIWDIITKEVEDPIRIRAEKLLISLTDKHVGFIIFLTEETENPTIEYMIDGVVLLTQEYYKSYRLREMQIEKLRGIQISRAKIPFTLEGGRFKAFSRLTHSFSSNIRSTFASISHNKEYYSTGNTSLDKRLNGGFRRGSVISVEISDEVDRFVFVPFLAPLVLNFISQENAALIIPAADQNVSNVIRYLAPHTKSDNMKKFLRIFASGASSKTESFAQQFSVSMDDKTNFQDAYDSWITIYRNLRENAQGGLFSIDYSFVELEYQDDIRSILKCIVDIARLVRASDDLLITISRPNYKSLEIMKNISDIHLRIFEYDGATMLAAIKPQLFLSNIQTNYGLGFPNALIQDST